MSTSIATITIEQPEPRAGAGLIRGQGEMADRIRALDWSHTPLGALDGWPEVLLVTVNLLLGTRQPMLLYWGEECLQIYNDAFRPSLGRDKHPFALGQRGAECWPEIWDALSPQIDAVIARGEATWHEDQLLPIYRDGVLEDVYWTYSYGPVRAGSGAIGGVLVVCLETTGRVLAERERNAHAGALATAQGRLLEVFQQAPAVFALLKGPHHLIEMVNPLYLQIVDHRDVLGRTVAEALPEAVEQGYLEILDRVYTTGIPHVGHSESFEITPAASGTPEERFLDYVYQPLRDPAGTITGIILVGVDVTARDRVAAVSAEAAATLRQSEERLELAVEAADFGTWSYDSTRRLFVGDAKMRELFGLNELQTAANHWLAQIYEEDRERVVAEFTASIAGQPYDTEYRIDAGGAIRWIRAKARLLSTGSASRMVGIVEDITGRKRTEEALRTSEERLRFAQAAARIASWEWDLATGNFIWDESSLLIYGRPPSEMTHVDQIFPYLLQEDRDRVRLDLLPAIEGRGEFNSEFRVIWPDGTMRWVQAFGRPILSPAGHPLRIVGANLDITDRKIAMEALIQNEKLAAVGRLASSIAHEINNPLESVTNLIFLAKNSDDVNDTRSYLITAENELRRAAAITNQTLRFHKQASRPTEISCEDLITGVLAIHHSRILNAGIRVYKQKRAQRSVLCFDGEIRQVLSNLIGNAIDALQVQGNRLTVRSREGHDWRSNQSGLFITIADNGSGMTPATADRIFEAFFSTKGIGGTGLGLWISRDIVERHNGRLTMRTSQRSGHSGTVFSMFLPFDAVTR